MEFTYVDWFLLGAIVVQSFSLGFVHNRTLRMREQINALITLDQDSDS